MEIRRGTPYIAFVQASDLIAERYRLVRKLGSGGMGAVWQATHEVTGRAVAVKLLHEGVTDDREGRSRFMREAQASARINHPNVIDVLDAGETDEGGLFLAMELLDGASLEEAMASQDPLCGRDFLVVMADACRGLAAAHDVNIVHRDVKPANIFLHRDKGKDEARGLVLDFGISKFIGNVDGVATSTGAVLGSPRYMSPEQIYGSGDIDHRTDIWSIGVLLFRGFTGRWPHQAENFTSLCIAIGTEPPFDIDVTAPELPASLRAVIKGCLRPREERWSSSADIAEQLEAIAGRPELATIRVHPASSGRSGSSSQVPVRTPSSLSSFDDVELTLVRASAPQAVLGGPAVPDGPTDIRMSTAPSGTMTSPLSPRSSGGALVGVVIGMAVTGAVGALGYTFMRTESPAATPASSSRPSPVPSLDVTTSSDPPPVEPSPSAAEEVPPVAPSASATASAETTPSPEPVVPRPRIPRPAPPVVVKKKKVEGEDLGSGI